MRESMPPWLLKQKSSPHRHQSLQLSAATVRLQHDNVETVNATGSLQALAILKRTAQYLFGLGFATGDDGSPADEQRRPFQFHNSSSHRVAAASDILTKLQTRADELRREATREPGFR